MECSGRWVEWDAGKGEVGEGTCRRGRTGGSIGLGRRRTLRSFCAPFPAAFSRGPRACDDATLAQFDLGNYAALSLPGQESSIIMSTY